MPNKRQPRPSSLKVGLTTYEIRWVTEADWERGQFPDDANGWCNNRQQFIALLHVPDCQEVEYQQTLLHEMQHAVWCTTKMQHHEFDDDDVEEISIRMNTPMLLMVLKENPIVMRYLMSDGSYRRD